MAPIEAGALPAERLSARRFFWPGGLSSRLLLLTLLFVALAGMMILPTALAGFERQWLLDRVRAAELASLAVDAAPNKVVSNKLSAQLLNGAGVVSVAVQSEGVRRLLLAAPRMQRTPYLVDLRGSAAATPILAPFETLFSGADRMVRVVARPRFRPGDFVEIVTSDGPLKTDMKRYLLRVSAVTAFISLIAGGLIYWLLDSLFVRPMQRITRAMERFRVDPDDPAARVALSGRRDELGRAEAELDRMQADLRTALSTHARLAALGQAVAKINHDLRNMLTSAQIASERLAQSGDPKVAQALPRLERALDRAIKLASDVLAYGKSEEAAPAVQAVPLNAALQAAAEDAGLGEAGVTLDIQIPPSGDIVHADPDQLHRILSNLLRNAREAMSGRKKTKSGDRIRVTLERGEGGASLVRIADNGPGVPERVQTRLFQPFSGSGRPDGSGLGLAIARELAQAHGGDLILAESSADGAIFELRLPSP